MVNCLFDETTNTIEDAEVVEANNIDYETKKYFGDKNMIILK